MFDISFWRCLYFVDILFTATEAAWVNSFKEQNTVFFVRSDVIHLESVLLKAQHDFFL